MNFRLVRRTSYQIEAHGADIPSLTFGFTFASQTGSRLNWLVVSLFE